MATDILSIFACGCEMYSNLFTRSNKVISGYEQYRVASEAPKFRFFSVVFFFLAVGVAALWCLWLPYCFQPPSLVSLVAVDPVELLRLLWESNKAHRSFCGTAILAGPGDGIANTAVGQPSGIAAIIAFELPRRVHVAHLGDLRTIIYACLHSLIIGQPVRLDQPVEMSL